MGNANDKKGKNQEFYPTMEHYASGGNKRVSLSSQRNSKKNKNLLQQKRTSLNGKRNTPRSVGTGRSSRRSGANLKDLDIPPVNHSRRRSEASSNRYEGLGEVSVLSGNNAKPSRRARTGSVSLVHGNREINLDLDPPPPPPSWDAVEKDLLKSNVQKHSEDELAFIDYTVIPLLLRAEIDYKQAEKFGNALKISYTGTKIRQFMANPFALFAVLEHEGVSLNDDIRFNIVEDKFWTDSKKEETRPRGNSYVYYKENASDSKVLRDKKQKPKSSRPRAGSVKIEFDQEIAKTDRKSVV